MSRDANRLTGSSWTGHLGLRSNQVSECLIQMLYLEMWRAKGVVLVLVVGDLAE